MKVSSVTRVVSGVSIGLSLVLSAFSLQAATVASMDAEAKAAVKALGGALQAEVQAAMKKEGPIGAIATCNTQAMPLTGQISTQQGVEISRTALRIRNPANQADSWEQGVLHQFQSRQAQGESLQGMSFSEVVEQDGQQVYRMMQAIPTQKGCLGCHGSDIATDVAQKLKSLYPMDRATGFAEGDLRGAFSIRKVL